MEGIWRSTSLRERDCLALDEPRRREECRSTRALSLRVTFLLREGEAGQKKKKRVAGGDQYAEEEVNAIVRVESVESERVGQMTEINQREEESHLRREIKEKMNKS